MKVALNDTTNITFTGQTFSFTGRGGTATTNTTNEAECIDEEKEDEEIEELGVKSPGMLLQERQNRAEQSGQVISLLNTPDKTKTLVFAGEDNTEVEVKKKTSSSSTVIASLPTGLDVPTDGERGSRAVGSDVWYPRPIPTEPTLKEAYMNATLSSSNNPTEEEIENDTTDVVFVVENNDFPVHKFVLTLRAKTLYELCSKKRQRNSTTRDDTDTDADDADGSARVRIPDISSATFEKVVEFIYTVNTTPILVDEATAMELLVAAKRFKCVSLKLYVESVLADKFVTPTNAATMFLLGEMYHCALLKEVASTTMNAGIVAGEDDTKRTMDVGTLRERLEEANLGLDGSREMLVTRYGTIVNSNNTKDNTNNIICK